PALRLSRVLPVEGQLGYAQTCQHREVGGSQHEIPATRHHLALPQLPLLAGAAARFLSCRASTSASISSSVSDCTPCCRAMRRTRQSTRSMCSAPPKSARAAEDGLPSPAAAAAYLSNGTRSSSFAPSVLHSFQTQS